MVPDKFNMVDMEGIDIITSQGEVVEGLYQKLVESITQCRYQCLYNWKFDGILIPPTYVEMDIVDDVVWINEGVSVDEEDVIRIYSLEPPVPEPRLLALAVSANGDYLPPADYDGFSSVNVSVPEPVFDLLRATANGTYQPPQGVDGYASVEVAVPTPEPVLTILSVTSNGTYTPQPGVDGYDEVIVNVPGGVSGVPFIESQGVAYFDTGVAGNTIYKIEYEFMPVSVLANYQWYAGAATNNFTVGSMTPAAGPSSGFIRVGNIDFGVVTYNLGQVNKVVCDNGVITLNNTQIAGSYTGPINTTTATLKLIGGSTASHSRMFSCKLYDQSNSLIKNYIPFLDSDYVACLKDLVSDTLLYPTTKKLTFGYALNGGF